MIESSFPSAPAQIRNLAFECLETIINTHNFSGESVKTIIGALGNQFPDFDNEFEIKIFRFYQLASNKSQDYQQCILYTLKYADIVSSLLHQYSNPEILHAAFLFVSSIFNYPTSELFSNKIAEIVPNLEPSPDRSYLITRVSVVMPVSLSKIGYNIVITSILDQINTNESQLIIDGLITLKGVIKYCKEGFDFDFSIIFNLLSNEDIQIRTTAVSVLTEIIFSFGDNGIHLLIENNIYKLISENLSNIRSIKEKTECIRFVAAFIYSIPNGEVDFVNSEIICELAESMAIDDFNLQILLTKALEKMANTQNEEIINDINQSLEDSGGMSLIIDYMSCENEQLAQSSSTLYAALQTPDFSDIDSEDF
ncbi:hypothetical protein TVAG_277070 [Trichomonas vaginalis G3]|uniref:Uncharacterized protein n=1 Tax=Trichomonas vaginalis (strain ATCC PRA-98 / G3) TaxID=412133 RepID=A2FP67_TRIV3|nr:armadillo (ARM) repeat-containing protein family [Trichomonas vaginalis G3]EAX93302.1 hypothetical protein TVAG_277070 [Trichomonas vaginalis G3]KAI5547486.1 armadillo (ARM) repeat-containing protein family [Trichomonas vaginalis G3]|eukprot:XP_001306232.1 hypothetical protein [Trichomonas vaginalis G3]